MSILHITHKKQIFTDIEKICYMLSKYVIKWFESVNYFNIFSLNKHTVG
jgi:hypothetical protein